MHRTFLRVARAAHDVDLLIGCATNGYYTKEALRGLAPVTVRTSDCSAATRQRGHGRPYRDHYTSPLPRQPHGFIGMQTVRPASSM
jgi:hypothetical protein